MDVSQQLLPLGQRSSRRDSTLSPWLQCLQTCSPFVTVSTLQALFYLKKGQEQEHCPFIKVERKLSTWLVLFLRLKLTHYRSFPESTRLDRENAMHDVFRPHVPKDTALRNIQMSSTIILYQNVEGRVIKITESRQNGTSVLRSNQLQIVWPS